MARVAQLELWVSVMRDRLHANIIVIQGVQLVSGVGLPHFLSHRLQVLSEYGEGQGTKVFHLAKTMLCKSREAKCREDRDWLY